MTFDERLVEKKDLKKIFWRSLPMELGWNYERQMHLAFAYMLNPLLKKLYGNQTEKYKAALERHLEFFNCTPYFVPFIGGIVASMEELNTKDEEFDTSSINAIKVALMGPLSGIGDSIFIGTLRVIVTGIAVSLAMQGSLLGPILFLLLFNIPAFAVRYIGVMKGYTLGTGYLQKIQKSGLMEKFMLAAAIIGVMVVGSMTKDMVFINLAAQIGQGESAVTLQSIMDGILPGALGLGVTGIYYWLIRKKVNIMWLIVGTAVFGVLFTWLGILA